MAIQFIYVTIACLKNFVKQTSIAVFCILEILMAYDMVRSYA